MDVRELRIGNKIKQAHAHIRVIAITPKYVWCADDNSHKCKCTPEKIEGIPLTPSILEQAGFERKGSYWCRGRMMLPIFPQKTGNDIICFTHGNDAALNIDYLHQLQNLYYITMGEELSISFNQK